MKRHIIIGDVHGCIDELRELMDALAPTEDDTVIFCGDLVDRGPNSLAVLRYVRNMGHTSVLGNHEEKHVRFRKWEKSGQKNPMRMAAWKHHELYTDDDIAFMASMPVMKRFSVDKQDFVVVHAGFDASAVPLEHQKMSMVIRIREVDERGLQREGSGIPWATRWWRQENVIYGHNVRSMGSPLMDVNAEGGWCLALDTGCVFGGRLSAYVIREDGSSSIVQVNARRDYWKLRNKELEY